MDNYLLCWMIFNFFDRKAIWPKHFLTEHRLTECHFTESSFDRIAVKPTPVDRKVIRPIFFSENGHLTKSSFDKKCHLTEKKLRIRSFDRKFIWPKVQLTESFFWKWSFDRKVISPKVYLTETFFLIIWPKVHLTESFFRKMVIWSKGHLSECLILIVVFEKLSSCSYSIRIVLTCAQLLRRRQEPWKKQIVPILSSLLFQSCRKYD
jgi:hypothetical protein